MAVHRRCVRCCFAILSVFSVCFTSGCSRQIGDYKYICWQGGIVSSFCQKKLPGPYDLLSLDGNPPKLYRVLSGGDFVGAIQTEDHSLELLQVGANKIGVVALLEGGKVYYSIFSKSEPDWRSLDGPVTLAEAKVVLKDNWPKLRDVQ